MIIKVSLGNGFNGTLLYIHKTGRKLKPNEVPLIIERNNVIGDNPRLLAYQMRLQAENSGYSKKPVLHLSFAFAPEDKLIQAKEVECIKNAMQHLGVSEENHQYVLVKHNDSNNPHYHAVINKVNTKSEILNTDWLRNKCIATADKMEQDYNLVRVENRKIKFEEISPNNTKGYRFLTAEERTWMRIKSTKINTYKYNKPKVLDQYSTLIQSRISFVLDNKLVNTIENFENELAKINVKTKINIDENTKKIKGISFKYNNETRVKGSDVGFSANVMNQRFEANKEIERHKTEALSNDKKLDQNKNIEPKQNILEKNDVDIKRKWDYLKKYYQYIKNLQKIEEEKKKERIKHIDIEEYRNKGRKM